MGVPYQSGIVFTLQVSTLILDDAPIAQHVLLIGLKLF